MKGVRLDGSVEDHSGQDLDREVSNEVAYQCWTKPGIWEPRA